MNSYDAIFFCWLALIALVGFWQGLSVVLLRFALASVFFFIMPYFEPSIKNLCENLFGAENSSMLSVIFLFMLMTLMTESVTIGYRRLRKAMHLTFPDRMAGLVAGLFVGVLIGVLASIHLYKTSVEMADHIDRSFSSVLYQALEPWLINVSEPSFKE